MLLAIGIVVVLLALVFGVPWVAGSTEKSAGSNGASGASGAFGVMEQIFHPAAHDANIVKMEIKRKKSVAPITEGDDDPDSPAPRQEQ